jgi:hypothetical protein
MFTPVPAFCSLHVQTPDADRQHNILARTPPCCLNLLLLLPLLLLPDDC